MLKCKKYCFRRFVPSPVPVRVLDKFPHGEIQVANPN
jgi:carbamate kinase